MSQQIPFDYLYAHISKYDFEYNNYVLPVVKDAEPEEKCLSETELNLVNPQIHLEAFKNEFVPIEPSICTFSFMSESELLEIKDEKNQKDQQKLIEIFDSKLTKICEIKGVPKVLLIELFISIVKFSNKYLYDVPQTGAMLAMFYNIHLYLSHNLFATPEEIYNFFTEYIYCHSVSVPPYKTKIFEPKEAHRFMMYFCSIYLRNLPIVRLLMFPNYALLLKTKNPVTEEELITKKGKGKKDKKEKKDKKGKKGKK